jgi:nanoRNase/pAp phosphatase (c-di-AMP/oligoRNAs hydrolase)
VLSSIAAELERGGVVALLHGNADPDALASAFAVQSCFPGVTIWTPGGTDRMAKEMTRSLGIRLDESPVRPQGTLLVLDTSGPEQLPAGIDFSDAVVVDHHSRTDRWSKARTYYCDDSKSSCSEIVLELVKAAGKGLPREAALALMAGIITDTGMFKFGKPSALRAFADLMEENGVQMDEATSLVYMDTDISERISQLRGAQRLKYWKVGEYIVAASQGSAYEASVCKALLSLGADVVFVGSQRGDDFRISARATQEMVRAGVHLGKLLGSVGSETSNGGGGHPGAAGITGVGDVEAILNISVENTIKLLRRIGEGSSRDGQGL